MIVKRFKEKSIEGSNAKFTWGIKDGKALAALLPSFPGMHGPRDAIRAGVKVSGATVFVVDAGVDTGKILLQAAVDVLDDDDVESLHERIKVVERRLLIQAVSEWKKEHP